MNEIFRILHESATKTIAGVLSAGVIAALAYAWRLRQRPIPIKPVPLPPSAATNSASRLGAVNIFLPSLGRNGISAIIHRRALLQVDASARAAFHRLNEIRRNSGKFEHYPSPRYRVLRRPDLLEKSGEMTVCLDLAELDFIHFALLTEADSDAAIRQQIRAQIEARLNRLPRRIRNSSLPPTAVNTGLLGIQMVLITSDGHTLLRKRGISVLENPGRWDVSFSGYAGSSAFVNGEFDLGNTVEYELEYEIRTLSADPRNMKFTGMHFCESSGTTVILGYWKIEASAEQLQACLTSKPRKQRPVFDTTVRAKEKYVWDAKNMIVAFEAAAIAKQLQAAEPLIAKEPAMLIPAARSSLLLALYAEGEPTAALEL